LRKTKKCPLLAGFFISTCTVGADKSAPAKMTEQESACGGALPGRVPGIACFRRESGGNVMKSFADKSAPANRPEHKSACGVMRPRAQVRH